jgi:hypothetical protein
MPLTSLVLKVCQACGKKLAVVRTAARVPIMSVKFMVGLQSE